ncbi:MAG: ComF family protein [Bacteroidetes bacterium]|uniref:ComF family protein n=1 Tax=Candidatus Cryptobacteroides excrementipullorum TaxID=2840761 RepID=A0A9D9IVP9_9BACT|nr:ComF family protein [Candidatus Cryptobacteroides excrementipullorum]
MEPFKRPLACISDLVLPRTCTVCGRRLLSFEKHICTSCLADLPLTFNWALPHNAMADRFNERIQENLFKDGEQSCFPGRHIPYCYATSLFFFNSEALYRHIPYSVKYRMDIPLGLFFGRMLGEMICLSPVLGDIDMVIPVPLHWTRKWKRGYNQAEVIARGIAGRIHADLCTGILFRSRRTATQTRLDIKGKEDNVRSAFAARKSIPPGIRHILLVDDVFTTGATLYACWQAVRTVSRDTRISIATLALVSN